MNCSALDFPPLKLDLLDEIKEQIEKLKTLPPWDPKTGTWVPEFYKIHKAIDDLTVKFIRAGAIKRGPDKVYRIPSKALAWAKQKGLDKPEIQHFYHPHLPLWAQNHLEEWIQRQSFRKEGRDTLRETGVVGLETGMKRPADLADIERRGLIKKRVLELRGGADRKGEDGDYGEVNEPGTYTASDKLSLRKKKVVTDEMLKHAKQQCEAQTKSGKKRTRKNSVTWNMVIDKLTEEKLLTRKISPQALKKWLQKQFPDYPWEKV